MDDGQIEAKFIPQNAAKANLLWHQHDVAGAHAEALRAYDFEPLNDAVLPVLAAAMVELKLKAELFKCAHKVRNRSFPLCSLDVLLYPHSC